MGHDISLKFFEGMDSREEVGERENKKRTSDRDCCLLEITGFRGRFFLSPMVIKVAREIDQWFLTWGGGGP